MSTVSIGNDYRWCKIEMCFNGMHMLQFSVRLWELLWNSSLLPAEKIVKQLANYNIWKKHSNGKQEREVFFNKLFMPWLTCQCKFWVTGQFHALLYPAITLANYLLKQLNWWWTQTTEYIKYALEQLNKNQKNQTNKQTKTKMGGTHQRGWGKDAILSVMTI